MVYMATPAIVGLNLLLLHISCVTSQSLPSFTIHPLSGVYFNLSEVSLRCEASPITGMQWLHNGHLIFTDSRRTVGLNTLTISSLTSDVAGSYACLARNDLDTVVSAVANIQIAVLEASLPTLANPRIVTVQEHQPVALNCGTIVTVPPFRHPLNWETYYSEFNLGLLENEFTGLNRSLYIPDPTVSRHDGNIYECIYRNRVNLMTVQGYVQFQVQASTAPPPAPHFIQEPQDLVVNVGEGAFFDCVVGGFPLPTSANITWLVPPTLQSQLIVTQRNRQARILTTQTADAGTYTCIVRGVGERRATLTVREPPVVTPLPSFVRNKVYGAPFSLECLATGIDVSWQWYHNGTLMETITGRTLNILSTVEEDSGVYQCFAYNPAGNNSAVAVLRVSPQPVTFTNRTLPPQQVAFVGQPFEFVCSATGAPPPQYFWSKSGVPLGNNSGFEVHLSGELKIGSVAVTHNGLYTCLAVNRIGEREIGSVEATSRLFAIVPTTITSPPVSESPAQRGTSTTLPCDASYQPGARVTYSWTKNGSPITIDGEAVSFASNTSGDIIIANVQNSDAGEYRCTVATTYNQLQAPSISSGVIRVTITTSPVGPMVFRVNATSTNITVSWYLTTFATNPPSMYAIEIQGRVASDRWHIVHNQSALAITNATVGNFRPFTWYRVRVVAVFSDGERVGSSVHTVMTNEDRPWGPPTNVKVSTINETTLQVQWEPPLVSDRNGLILSYTIKYRPRNTGSFISVSLDNVTSHLLTGLREKALYDVRVAANTSVGIGPFSDVLVASTNIGGLQENPDPAFYQTAWFIVVMFLLVLGLLTGAVVVVCVVRRHSTRGKKKYHVRPASGYFGAGVKDVSLSEAAMNDYESRSSRFGSAKGYEGVETESSLMGSHSTQYTPSLQMRLAAINAPSYIDPPPFEEALKHRARPHSASMQPEITGTTSDWSVEQGSRSGLLTTHHPHLAMELHANGPVQYDYADSGESDSAEKPSYSSLEGSEESPSQVSNAHSSPTTKYATFV